MNLEHVLKTILAKNTSQWSGNIIFEQKTKEKLNKDKIENISISFHFFYTEEGIPMIALAYNKMNITLKTEYIIHFNKKLLEGMLKDLNTAIQYMIYSADSCSSTEVLAAIEKDMEKYRKKIDREQIKGVRPAS